jgi:predicted neutral ceramidase superfamily lipid hydrolase
MKKGDIWFMDLTNKEIVRNVFSVVAGVLVSYVLYLLFGLILLLFIASKVKGHGEESGLKKLSTTLDITSIIALFICCLLGGFVTGKISTKKDMIHGGITAIVSCILLVIISDFDFSNESLVYYLVSILATLLGTTLAIKQKKKKDFQNLNRL